MSLLALAATSVFDLIFASFDADADTALFVDATVELVTAVVVFVTAAVLIAAFAATWVVECNSGFTRASTNIYPQAATARAVYFFDDCLRSSIVFV